MRLPAIEEAWFRLRLIIVVLACKFNFVWRVDFQTAHKLFAFEICRSSYLARRESFEATGRHAMDSMRCRYNLGLVAPPCVFVWQPATPSREVTNTRDTLCLLWHGETRFWLLKNCSSLWSYLTKLKVAIDILVWPPIKHMQDCHCCLKVVEKHVDVTAYSGKPFPLVRFLWVHAVVSFVL